ncbi:MAG: hypothetical protein F6K17_08080 [Okeania sp. SIO3C4]|nr:hypothetical protein [Okeania sp. SIO3C4]
MLTVYILGTKYNLDDKPSTIDINQVVVYATYQNCYSVVLIYPKKLIHPIYLRVGSRGVGE